MKKYTRADALIGPGHWNYQFFRDDVGIAPYKK